jgi:hypothetical protein
VPSYDIATVAFAVEAPRKWVDNTCSHFAIPGVSSDRRGVSRRFSFDGVLALQLIRDLTAEIGFPVRDAVRLATAILADAHATASYTHGIVVGVQVDTITQHVQQRLLEAAESVPRVRRGRPPSTGGATGAKA